MSDYDLDQLEKLILKGVNRYDVPPRKPIVELGFSASLYTRQPGDLCAGLSVHCGCYEERLTTANSVVFRLPVDVAAAGVEGMDKIEDFFDLGQQAWAAERGAAFGYHRLGPIVEQVFR